MGRLSAMSPNLSAAAKRKPLSLKLERKNSPKKAAVKTSYCFDKENQNNVNAMPQDINVKKMKVRSETQENVSHVQESEERMALRKRVEEAVASHLAQRSPESVPEQFGSKEEFVEETCPERRSLFTEVELCVPEKVVSPKNRNIFTILAMLGVAMIAIWSGVRVALLKPDTVLAVYQRYTDTVTAMVPSELLLRTAEPMHAFQEYINIDLSEEVTEGLQYPTMDDYSFDSRYEMSGVEAEEEVEVIEVEGGATEEEATNVAEVLEVLEVPDVATLAEHTESSSIVVNPSSEVVLALAAPVTGRTQMILRKAFDVLSPLKRVLAKVQDKIVHWMHGIKILFSAKN